MTKPTASCIERGEGEGAARMANSIAEPMSAFLTAVRDTERAANDAFGGESRMRKPEHDATLRQIAEMLSRPGHTPALNPQLAAFLRDGAVLASLGEGPTPNDGSVSDADAFSHLWTSIDLSITRCPACERLMDPNWGWCPYHADPTFFSKPENELEPTEDAFQDFLKKGEDYGSDLTILEHLNAPMQSDDEKKKRLFVHWTEFEVFRRAAGADADE